jgi:uncharacterized protein YciI
MWYAVIGQDVENSLPLRKVHRAAHLERLNQLNSAGRLLVAGPHPAEDSSEPSDAGFTGSLLVVEFDSLDDAKKWANADPYFLNGVYQSVIVKPFIKALP